MTPIIRVRFGPIMSLIRPPSSRRPPNPSVYAVTTHWRSVFENPSDRCAEGRAMIMTVVSRTTISWAPAMTTRIHQWALVGPDVSLVRSVSASTVTSAVCPSRRSRSPAVAGRTPGPELGGPVLPGFQNQRAPVQSRGSRTPARRCAWSRVDAAAGWLMAATVITGYDWRMSRWAPDARGRLATAAMELYSERGFDSTTVAQIAERAGLGERTFFRHFADKREVLFGGGAALQEFLVSSVDGAPASLPPIEVIAAALQQAASVIFEERREFARQRRAIIAANPELQERELIKLASLARALADALRRRGVGDPTSDLAAEAGIAVFRIAFERWTDDCGGSTLSAMIGESLDELKQVTGGRRPPSRRRR